MPSRATGTPTDGSRFLDKESKAATAPAVLRAGLFALLLYSCAIKWRFKIRFGTPTSSLADWPALVYQTWKPLQLQLVYQKKFISTVIEASISKVTSFSNKKEIFFLITKKYRFYIQVNFITQSARIQNLDLDRPRVAVFCCFHTT